MRITQLACFCVCLCRAEKNAAEARRRHKGIGLGELIQEPVSIIGVMRASREKMQ